MRDSLTVLAILLIGVLTAALVGPYLVDWDGHRAFIERELSEAAGTPVTVAGPIDLRILPKPLFRFGDVTIGDGAGGRPRLAARALDAELSLTALMRGQVQVVDTVLVRPTLDLAQAADGGFGFDPPSEPSADRVAVDRLALRDATLDLALSDGRHARLTGIDLEGEATSLRGPFKATGRIGAVTFRLGTGALDRGGLRVKLHLDGAGGRPSLDVDGIATMRPGGHGPGFDGTATASGRVALDGTPATVPWRGTARLSVGRDGAEATDVELRAGTDLRAFIASGRGTAAYSAGSAPPRASLRLRGAALDVDRLAVPPAGSDIAAPGGPDLVGLLLRGIGDGAGLGGSPLRLDLGADVETATLAGRTLLDTTATLGLGPEAGAALTFAANGPEGARLALDGRVEPGPPPPVAGPFGAGPAPASALFHGRAEIRTRDLRGTAAWLRPAVPDFADGLAAVPVRSVAAQGTIDASASGIAARDLDLHVDGTALSGALTFTPAIPFGRARLFVDLSADALALDGVPDPSAAAAAFRALDLDLSLAARSVTFASSAAGALAAGHLALHVTRAGDDATLEKLAFDIDGGRLDATGSRDRRGARGAVHLSAPQLGPLVPALASLLPAPAAAGLRARAALLSPVDATLTVEAAAAEGGALAPTAFALAGTAAGTRFDAALTPEGAAAGRDVAHRPVALSLRAEAPDGAGLLSLLGLATPGAVEGAARVSGTAQGTLADGFTGTLDASLGRTTLSYAGRAGTEGGAGRFALRSPDLGPAMVGLGLLLPAAALAAEAEGDLAWDGSTARWRGVSARVGGTGVAGDLSLDLAPRRGSAGEPLPVLHGRLAVDRLPADALFGLALGPPSPPAGGAAWSAQPFAPAPATLPRSELALDVAEMPMRGALVGRGVSLTLRTAPDSVAAAEVSGDVGRGGRFGGAMAVRRDGAGATLSGRLSWRDVPVESGGLRARVGGAEDVAASGTSPAALVAGLAGTGTLSLSDATLARTDPGAPARVLAAASARDAAAERGSDATAPTPPDAEALRSEVAAALDAAPLVLGTVSAPALLAGGVLRVDLLRQAAPAGRVEPGASPAPGWSAETDLALDLATLVLTTRVDLRAASPGDVVATRVGPFGGDAPRTVDVAGLVEVLQAQALARARDRIDVMEQDLRERAAFNRQRKAMAQRQQLDRDEAAFAEAQKAAAARALVEAQKAAAEQRRADEALQKAEDARMQAQVESAARAEAVHDRAVRDEAEKQRFIDRVLKSGDAQPDPGPRDRSLASPRSLAGRPPPAGARDPFDPPPPPSILRDGGTGP